jgi:molybdenum cofactor biosynthesis enzyme MoaA
MYFHPDGTVRACCSTTHEFGYAGMGPRHRTSLADLWQGVAADQHRTALSVGDFSLGCQECEVAINAGSRDLSLAAYFDDYRDGSPHAYPRMMDFALSNRCNLACVMCSGDYSSTIRRRREGRLPLPKAYGDEFHAELREFLPHLHRAHFKGGEPFLSAEARRVWDDMVQLGCDCTTVVTTNGTIWNANVERYVRDLGMNVDISVDAIDRGRLEAIRQGIRADRFWDNVGHLAAAARDVGGRVTLNFCLMTLNWDQLADFFVEADRMGAYPHVLLVTEPPEYSLLDLPVADLARIVRSLERRGKRLKRQLGSGLAEWTAQLERLHQHVESPVSIRRSAPPSSPDAPVTWFDGFTMSDEARQGRIAGSAPSVEALVLRVRGEQIDGLELQPAWAAWLDCENWLGHGVAEIPTLVGRRVGAEPAVAVEQEGDGVIRASMSFAARPDSGLSGLDALFFPAPSDGGQQVIRIVPADR